MDGRVEGRVTGCVDGRVEGRVEGCVDGRVEGRVTGWVEGLVAGRVDPPPGRVEGVEGRPVPAGRVVFCQDPLSLRSQVPSLFLR